MVNFMRTMLLSIIATLKLGMDILAEEGVMPTQLLGHGGFFKTERVGQQHRAGLHWRGGFFRIYGKDTRLVWPWKGRL